VSTEARAVHFPAEDWGGGVHPYRVGHRKLGMWLFIVVFGAADWLQLSPRLKRLAHAVSVLSQYCLCVGHDLLSAVVELDDGIWGLGFEPGRQSPRAKMDTRYYRLRGRFRGAALN
jgi:hypothetical protein